MDRIDYILNSVTISWKNEFNTKSGTIYALIINGAISPLKNPLVTFLNISKNSLHEMIEHSIIRSTRSKVLADLIV